LEAQDMSVFEESQGIPPTQQETQVVYETQEFAEMPRFCEMQNENEALEPSKTGGKMHTHDGSNKREVAPPSPEHNEMLFSSTPSTRNVLNPNSVRKEGQDLRRHLVSTVSIPADRLTFSKKNATNAVASDGGGRRPLVEVGSPSTVRSRANTASRMAPPATLPSLSRSIQGRMDPPSPVQLRHQINQHSSISEPKKNDSPDMEPKSQRIRLVYSHKPSSSSKDTRDVSPVAAVGSPGHKRKASAAHNDGGDAKRARDLPKNQEASCGSSSQPGRSNSWRSPYSTNSQLRSSSHAVNHRSNENSFSARRSKS
jgi:hypothetical protein